MPETDNNRYKILEQDTTGWNVVAEAQNLTKEELNKNYKSAINENAELKNKQNLNKEKYFLEFKKF